MVEPVQRETRGKGFGCTWKCPICNKMMQTKKMAESHILNKHK